MKTVFTQGGIVIGYGTGQQVVSGVASIDYVVPDNSQVDVGWMVALESGLPVFTAPVATYRPLTAGQFYNCFTAAEMIAIKGSADQFVKEFLARWQVSLQANENVNPNLISVQEGLAYLSVTNQLPSVTPEATYILPARIPQILSGVPQ